MAFYGDNDREWFSEYPVYEQQTPQPQTNKKRNVNHAFGNQMNAPVHYVTPSNCVIKREDSGAEKLNDIRDSNTCYEIINDIYSSVSSVEEHQIGVKENYYVIKFSPAYEITSTLIRGIVTKNNNIRDIKIQPINAIQDVVNKASFTILIEVLSYHTKDLINNNNKRSITDYVDDNIVPTFTPSNVIEYEIEKVLFAKTVLGDKATSLPNSLILPYNIINDIANAIVNINSTPPDMGVSLMYEELPNKQNRKIYGIKFIDFPDVHYSLIEYIDLIKSSNNYLYNVKFNSDKNRQQNVLTIQLLERENGSTDISETINGEQYYLSFPKRNRVNIDSTTPVIAKKTKTETDTVLKDDNDNNNNNGRRSFLSLFSRKK